MLFVAHPASKPRACRFLYLLHCSSGHVFFNPFGIGRNFLSIPRHISIGPLKALGHEGLQTRGGGPYLGS